MTEPQAKLTPNEQLKGRCPTLAGTIATALADPASDRFSEDDVQFLKFHGVYQQDDRDLRKTSKSWIMMVRSRIPGGVMTAAQWRVLDELASRYGNHTLRITTRQTIQFHGVLKANLRAVVKGINDSLLSTLAACGDVNRNVVCSPTPAYTRAQAAVYEDCRRVALALAPRTPAYHSIWIDGVQLNLEDEANKNFVDPLYGQTYLPRKFKTGFVVPPVNDVDIFTNDQGYIAIIEHDEVVGYNLAVGGGMGRSHGNAATYPRLADVIGFVPRERILEAARAVLTIHRDFGDRTNRRHARLKYVVAERGVDWARQEVEKRARFKLEPSRPFHFTSTSDLYGWHRAVDGSWFLTLYVESGRVRDLQGHRLKTALRQVAEQFPWLEFRLTPNQNVILAQVPEADKSAVTAVLATNGVRSENQTSAVRATALACPALPTCGLALAESERFMPQVLLQLDQVLAELGLAGAELVVRMTGCPNGCARPYTAEIGFVGKAPGRYQIWLGGDGAGTRLNRLFRDTVRGEDLVQELRLVLARYARERAAGERFGDWCVRTWNRLHPAPSPALPAHPPEG